LFYSQKDPSGLLTFVGVSQPEESSGDSKPLFVASVGITYQYYQFLKREVKNG
jgi:hypothetical protein